MEDEDIEKIRLVSDAEMLAEGLATEDEDGQLPTAKGMVEAHKYWDTLVPKQKLFILWIMKARFRHLM